MATEILLVALAVVGALGLVVKYPEFTRRWYGRIAKARMTVFGVAMVFIGLFLVSSGMLTLMAIGFGMLTLVTLGIVDELGLLEW